MARRPRAPRLEDCEVTEGVTIDARPEAVWPWLMQVGQDRGGFYSYDWLERLFTLFELPHFIMERRMLLGIKERAERGMAL